MRPVKRISLPGALEGTDYGIEGVMSAWLTFHPSLKAGPAMDACAGPLQSRKCTEVEMPPGDHYLHPSLGEVVSTQTTHSNRHNLELACRKETTPKGFVLHLQHSSYRRRGDTLTEQHISTLKPGDARVASIAAAADAAAAFLRGSPIADSIGDGRALGLNVIGRRGP